MENIIIATESALDKIIERIIDQRILQSTV